jgi:hypothetical protein
MCDIYDVLESSYGSADEIVSTVYEYGENNLGNGIRKIAGDMLMVGQDLGYNECRDKAVPIAYDLGKGDGIIEGSIITLCATAAVAAITVGVCKLVKHIKSKKSKPTIITESESPTEEVIPCQDEFDEEGDNGDT